MGVNYTKRGKRSWLITVVSRGEREYRTIRGTEADAKALVQFVRRQELAGVNVIDSLRNARSSGEVARTYPTLYDGVKAFIEARIATNDIRGGTGPSYLSRLETWTKVFAIPHPLAGAGKQLGSLNIDQVTREHLGALIRHIKGQGRGQGIIDGVRLPIKQYYDELRETKVYNGPNPAADLKYFIGKQVVKKAKARARRSVAVFSEDNEWPTLKASCQKWYARRFAFLLSGFLQGLRWGESVALARTDFDFSRGYLHVWKTWSEKSGRIELVKDTEERWVPLHPEFVAAAREHVEAVDAVAEVQRWDRDREALLERCSPDVRDRAEKEWPVGLRVLVFPNTVGKIDGSSGAFYEHLWNSLLDACALPRRKWHASRHSYITWALNHGADAREVAACVGHASLEQLRDYDHVTVGRSARAFAAIGSGTITDG
jgi:integrase